MDTATDNSEAMVAFEVYTAARNLLPRDCKQRCDIATLVMLLALHGHNPQLIAEKMGRSEPWVYKRIRMAVEVFDPEY